MHKTRKEGIIVPPQSKDKISAFANTIRKACDLYDTPYFPIVEFYEHLELITDGASFEVREIEEMGEDHGRTYPDKNLIHIREDIYEGAFDKKPRDRFTMAHELGHLVMHRGVALSRIDPHSPPKIFLNSEWQADTFASYLLIPKHLICHYNSIEAVIVDFGVSYEAAYARRDELRR